MVTVCNFVTSATASAAALAAISHAKKLFLQSALHPCARDLIEMGLPYESMDDLYESAENFDALHEAIARRLHASGDCTYVMTGSLSDKQVRAIRAACPDASVLPGVTLAGAAFPGEDAFVRASAYDLSAFFDPDRGAAIEELDSALVAGEAKLALSRFYPERLPVRLRRLAADGTFSEMSFLLYELDRQKTYDASCVLLLPAVPFLERDSYDFDGLMRIMRRLRARDGCPWDRVQTHESLREPLLEECYELLDAIESGDDAHMLEELGDVLMQVAFHAEIAAEQGRFDERDVATGIIEKLVYRHPHVFGSVRADTPDEVLKNWDALKRIEKGQATVADAIRAVPKNFPSLIYARKVQKKASGVGFDWPDAEAAFYKIAEETDELFRAMHGDGDVDEEMGDLLFAVVNVSRLLHQDPELLLRAAAEKFADRFMRMERAVLAAGKDLSEMTLSEMDAVWDEVKKSPNLG